MKKILSFAALSLLSLTMFAGPVSPDKALQVAGRFFGDGGTRASALTIVWMGEDGPATRSAATETPALYAINRAGGGFVIVAGDDNARPILGFSEEGRFVADAMPEHVAEWMRGLKLYCRQAAAGPVNEDISVLWEAFEPATRGKKITAEVTDEYTASQTLEWGQSGYNNAENFNIYCPYDDAANARSVTGCLPLALAEIVTWQSANGFSVPSSGTGSVGGYAAATNYYTPAAYDLGETYQWNLFNTRNALYMYNSATTEEKQAVSRVIADFGAALQVQYSAGGSSGHDGYVIQAFGDHFHYSKDAQLLYSDLYSLREWKDMLKAQIQVTPLLYSGQSPSAGGHSFVMDGYARYLSDDVFHFNFGWFGQNNGYYFLPDLDTSNANDGSENWAYSNVSALFGFVPDPSNTTTYSSPVLAFFNHGVTPGGISVDTDQIVKNVSFNMTASYIINEGPTTYDGYLRFDLVGKNGTPKAVLAEVTFDDVPPGSFSGNIGPFNFQFGSDYIREYNTNYVFEGELEFGDYLTVSYLPSGMADEDANYVPVRASDDGALVSKYPIYGAAFIDTSGSPTVGNPFNLRLMNAPYAYNGLTYKTDWKVSFPNGSSLAIPAMESVFTPTAAGTYHLKATVTNRSTSTVLEIIEADLVVN